MDDGEANGDRIVQLQDQIKELESRIECGRAAHNEERVARDWLAREKDRLEKDNEALIMRAIRSEEKLTAAREAVKRFIVAQGPHLSATWRAELLKGCGLLTDVRGSFVPIETEEKR